MSNYLAWSPLDGIKDVINKDIIPLIVSPTPTTFIDPHLLINPAIDFEAIPLISGVPTNTPVPPTNTPLPSSPADTPTSPSPTTNPQVSPTITSSVTSSSVPTEIPSTDTTISTESTPSSPQTITINSNNYLVAAIVVLLFIVLFLSWPKIKSWLHRKTE